MVRELRQQVLRAGRTKGEFSYPDDPAITHLAVLVGSRAVSCATTFPEPCGEEPNAWRIRGMATDPQWQGRGYGRALLAEAAARAQAAGVALLWCNARVPALGFYQECGFVIEGPEFTTETGIPHRLAIRRLTG